MLRLLRPRNRPPPVEIYWANDLRPLRIAIMPRPRGGDLLDGELDQLAQAGVHTLVSLLTVGEAEREGLAQEAQLCEAHGIEFRHFAVADHQTPHSVELFLRFVDGIVPTLQRHRAVAVHCYAGIGRSALTAGTLLLRAGVPPRRIFPALSRARGMNVPETTEQALWFRALADAPPS